MKKVSYSGLHRWLSRKFVSPKECENCKVQGKKSGRSWSIDWANKSGKYLRDRKDWLCLCRGCHGKYDYENGLRKLKKLMPKALPNGMKGNYKSNSKISIFCKDCQLKIRKGWKEEKRARKLKIVEVGQQVSGKIKVTHENKNESK